MMFIFPWDLFPKVPEKWIYLLIKFFVGVLPVALDHQLNYQSYVWNIDKKNPDNTESTMIVNNPCHAMAELDFQEKTLGPPGP